MLKTSLFLLLAAASGLLGQAQKIDTSKSIVILPFESTVKSAPGFSDAARASVIAYLKDAKTFAGVLTPEEAKDKSGVLELNATLADFSGGNMATRAIVGLGSGRAHAGFDFVLKEGERTIWQKRIKETASFWSNSASSSSQRQELP